MRELNVPTLNEILDSSAAKYGEDPFIEFVCDKEVCKKSYVRFRSDVLSVAAYIRSLFPGKAHIAVASKTNYEYIVVLMAVIASGNVLVPLAPEVLPEEASRLMKSADVTGFFYGKSFEPKADDIDALCPFLEHSINFAEPGFIDGKVSEFPDLEKFDIDKNDCVAIVFTSGTTGKKKGVMLSTNSLIGNILYTDYWPVLTRGRSVLSVLPMHHLYCFSGDIIRNLHDGVTVCLNGELRDLNRNLLRFSPYVMRVVPLIAASLLQKAKAYAAKHPGMASREVAEAVYGKNLKQIISGAAYLNPEIIDEYKKMGIHIQQGYGMTEAGCRISVPDINAPDDCVGRVIDICDVRVQGGEIQVHTPSVMLGYYKMPEDTAACFTSDGWLRTGDIGHVSEEGYLFITGRLKNLIILSGGENISPEAIEKKFAGFHAISEIMVYEENNHLAADIHPDYDYCAENGIDDVENYIREHVKAVNLTAKPSHIIAEVRIIKDPLPKNHMGKIKRKRTIIN